MSGTLKHNSACNMMNLVDTDRLPQQPLDKAASSILTDRSIAYARASWQQCTCCEEWIEEENIEYCFTCTLDTSKNGAPKIQFELKTRYPAYTCTSCRAASKRPVAATAGADAEDDEEAEQLCPLHVQAVYTLQGSKAADNMGAIKKGFIIHCPDCHDKTDLLKTPQQVKDFIQHHVTHRSTCKTLSKALKAGTYDSPAAFGGTSCSSPVQPEKVINELFSRLIVLTACHIVGNTRPPPTPVDQLMGEARKTAAATAHLRSSCKGESSSEGRQLLPYRAWAVDALSMDSDLLTEANWVRPSLEGLTLDHKPSLLDLVLAPPYIAVAEHDAGMTADKLAVLLLREQQRQKQSSLRRVAAAVAVGEQLPAAVAAVEAAIADLLADDAVFQHIPQQQRGQQLLDLAGIASIGDVLFALAQHHVQGRSGQNCQSSLIRYLDVCAVCGMTPGALKRAKRPWALHRCKYCIICTCQTCRQEQQQQQQPVPISSTEAAATEQLCLWCQGHPDTQDLDMAAGTSSREAGRGQQQQQYYAMSSPEVSADMEEAAAVLWGVRRSSDNSLDSQRRPSPAAAAGGIIERPAKDYDLVVKLAASAAAGQSTQDHTASAHRVRNASGPAPSSVTDKTLANNKLQQEMEELQRLQAELQQAAECLGVQGLQLPTLKQEQHQDDGTNSKRVRSPGGGAAAVDATASKRQCLQPPQQQHKPLSATAPAATAVGVIQQPYVVCVPQYQRLVVPPGTIPNPTTTIPSPAAAAAAAADAKRVRAAPVPRCGDCKTCNNPKLRRGCIVNRKRSDQGLPPILPPGGSALTAAGVTSPEQAAVAAATGADKGLTGLLLSSAGFKPVGTTAAARPGQDRPRQAAADSPAEVLQAPDTFELLVDAGFKDPRQSAAEAASQPPGSVRVKQEQQEQQQELFVRQPAAEPNTAAAPPAAKLLVTSLESDIQQLRSDISSWCSANLAEEHADVNKTLKVMEQLKQQLSDNHQQTGQQLFLQGLQILAEIVAAFNTLPDAGSKVVLACNSQRHVPGACCPDRQACSVFELLMCCWFKEMQDAELSTAPAVAALAAADGPPTGQQEVAAGYCHLVLGLLAQLSSLQHHLYYGPLAAGEGPPGPAGQKVAAALREAVMHVMCGTAVLLLHWPQEATPDDSSSRWSALAVQWRQCMLQCKWGLANKLRVGGGGADKALEDLRSVCAELMLLMSTS